MKQMKKTVTILMLFAMLLSTCGIMASAFHVAVETEPVKLVSVLADEIVPQRYERCEVCGTGKVNYSFTTYTKWGLAYYLDCPHGDPSVKDRFELREATAIYTCDTCGCTRFQHLEQESRIYCTSKR